MWWIAQVGSSYCVLVGLLTVLCWMLVVLFMGWGIPPILFNSIFGLSKKKKKIMFHQNFNISYRVCSTDRIMFKLSEVSYTLIMSLFPPIPMRIISSAISCINYVTKNISILHSSIAFDLVESTHMCKLDKIIYNVLHICCTLFLVRHSMNLFLLIWFVDNNYQFIRYNHEHDDNQNQQISSHVQGISIMQDTLPRENDIEYYKFFPCRYNLKLEMVP